MAKKNPTLAEDQGRCLDTAICVSSGANQADSSGTPFRPSYSIYIAVPTLGMYREKGRAWSERLLSGIENIPGMKLIGLTHNDKYTDRYQFYLESETMINPWPELERAILLIFDSVAPAVMPASSYEKWRAELVKFSPSQARSEVAKELVEKVKNAREAVNFLNSSGNMPDTDTAREIYTAVTSPNIWKINTLKEKNIDILPAETAYAVKDALKTMKEYASDMMKLTEVWAARAFLPFTSPFAVSFVKGNSYGSQSQDFSFNTAEEYLDALRKKAFSETFSKDVLGLAQSAVLSVKHFPMSPYRITNTAPTANIARDGAEDNYDVTEDKVNDTIAKLDDFITSEDFCSLVGLKSKDGTVYSNLPEAIDDILTSNIFTDETVNTLVSLLFPMICNTIEDLLNDLPSLGVAGIYAPTEAGAVCRIDLGILSNGTATGSLEKNITYENTKGIVPLLKVPPIGLSKSRTAR